MQEVREEIQELKGYIEQNKTQDTTVSFVRVEDYEEEYSLGEILDIQEDFYYEAKSYLKDKHKGEYAIIQGVRAVHIAKVEIIKDNKVMGWEIC